MFEKYIRELRAHLTQQNELLEALLVIAGDVRDRLDRAPVLNEATKVDRIHDRTGGEE